MRALEQNRLELIDALVAESDLPGITADFNQDLYPASPI
jgi:hypothetical protein